MNLKTSEFITNYDFILFSNFLTRHGWNNDGKYSDIFTIWHRPEQNSSEYELILPESRNIKHYNVTIAKILDGLSNYYNKSNSQIIDDFNNSIRDKVKFSIKSEMTKDGMIPLNEGLRLLDNTKEMLAASLLAVNHKKKIILDKDQIQLMIF
jgi:hypothetical protein